MYENLVLVVSFGGKMKKGFGRYKVHALFHIHTKLLYKEKLMKELMIKPSIYTYDSVQNFVEDFQIGKDDLIVTNSFIFEPFFQNLHIEAQVIYQEKYGQGEPTDVMLDAIAADIQGNPKRIIAIGGGTVIDISKVLSLKNVVPSDALFNGELEIVREKELVIIPTTCGTGSEVTNVAILALTKRNTKKGLAVDALYANSAVLIPELLKGLPFKFFATSSIDALIHAFESILSPKATDSTKLFGYRAIDLIINGYKQIAQNGPEKRLDLLDKFLTASMYAGVSFGNAGCAAVHALSYPLGATYHVPHGESNYAIFLGVMKTYVNIQKTGEIETLNNYVAHLLGCDVSTVYENLEHLLNNIIQLKPLRAYGVKKEELSSFTASVIENQQRLLANNFVPLSKEQILAIYTCLY